MSKIKRFEVVRPEYSFEYIHPILGRLALPIAISANYKLGWRGKECM